MANITPLNGGWNRLNATHLLWRAQGGASAEDIERALEDGLEKTVARLLVAGQPDPEYTETERILRQAAIKSDDIGKLKAWWMYRLLRSPHPLEERMTLLWHNHFATSNAKVESVKHMLAQNELMRGEALGSFRNLLSAMTRDVAMLIWLDGNANRKRQPNENFAREIMELFSLGEGNYTEQDIKEAARAFTGWHLRGESFWFNRLQHDAGEKSVLGRSGNLGGEDVVDICLEQKACPRFIATKLLKTFVADRPAKELVDALGDRIRKHDFQMTPVLREIFTSEVFYAEDARHSIIKSPIELVTGAFRALGGRPNLGELVRFSAELGQNLFEPPTVKGWEGGRLWINSTTLLQRRNFAAQLASGKRFGEIDEPADSAPGNPDDAVAYHIDLLLSRKLPDHAISELSNYLENAGGGTNTRMRGLVQLVLSMPEYQLI